MKITFPHLFFILLAFLPFASMNVGRAESCDTCVKLQKVLADFKTRKDALRQLLEKNRQALNQAASGNASVRIKHTSNMLMITIELETIENNEQRVQAYAAKIGCAKCARVPGTAGRPNG